MLQLILNRLARVFEADRRFHLLAYVLDLKRVCYDLIEVGLGIGIIVHRLKYLLAKVIHRFCV